MPVQSLVLVRSQFVNHRLDAKHQKLVPQMQTKLEVLLTRPIVQHRIDERHNGRFQVDVVSVSTRRSVQIVDDALETRSFCGESLKVQHGRQDFLVTARHKADGAQNFERSNFRFDVVGGQRLGDRVDTGWMSEHVRATSLLRSMVICCGFNIKHHIVKLTELFISALMHPMRLVCNGLLATRTSNV